MVKSIGNKWMLSLIASIVAAVMAMPALVAHANASFPDVPEDHDYADFISDLADAEVVEGYPDDEFKLGERITRAQTAVMFDRIMEFPVVSTKVPFPDVKPDVWYTDSIQTLHNSGHIEGYKDGTFAPNKQITRAEFAKIIVAVYNIPKKTVELPFNDVKQDVWYEQPIMTLYGQGLINGQDAETFGTHETIKRGDAAKLLAQTDYRYGSTLPKRPFTLSLMQTGDTHAHLDDVARRVTAVNNFREQYPDALLFESGDVFSGTLYFNEFEGMADLAFMNLMEYDGMSFGNHEFDLGSRDKGHSALAQFVKNADFPFISANIDFSKDADLSPLFNEGVADFANNGEIHEGMIKHVNGEKIGFFGLTTEDTANISSPVELVFEDYAKEAEKMVEAFESEGINKIVAVTHLGLDNPKTHNDLELAARVDGIDIILGSHTHTKLDEPIMITEDKDGNKKDPTLISHTYQYNQYLGTMNIEFDANGVIKNHDVEYVKIADQNKDPEAEELLKTYKDRVDELMNEDTGAVALKDLPNPRRSDNPEGRSVRANETALGNLIADGMLSKAKEFNEKTVIAFQNGGGIRAPIDEGPITTGEVIEVLPFGNTLALMELTGSEIIETLEHSVSNAPAENGGFLQVSGMTFKYDSSAPVGKRIKKAQIKKGDVYHGIETDETYVVATNAFTGKGGDGFEALKKAFDQGRMEDLGLSDWENLREHVIALGDVNPEVEGRIVDIAGKDPGDEGGGETPVDPDPEPDMENVAQDQFTGTSEEPKVYSTSVKVTASGEGTLAYAVVDGDLIITGDAISLDLTNVEVTGDLDLSGLQTDRQVDFSAVTVHGDTIL